MTKRTIRKILTAALLLLIGFLVLQALGYGVGFAHDPASGVKEFGYEKRFYQIKGQLQDTHDGRDQEGLPR